MAAEAPRLYPVPLSNARDTQFVPGYPTKQRVRVVGVPAGRGFVASAMMDVTSPDGRITGSTLVETRGGTPDSAVRRFNAALIRRGLGKGAVLTTYAEDGAPDDYHMIFPSATVK